MTQSFFEKLTRRSAAAALIAGALMMGASTAQAANANAEKQVEAAARTLIDNYIKNDVEVYFGQMADDITMWAGGGTNTNRTTKQGYYTNWKDLIGRGGGIAKGSIDDMHVQVSPSGDAGIVTMILNVTQKVPRDSTNPPRDIVYKISQIYFLRGGKWMLTHYHWSTVTPGGAPAGGAAPAPAATPAPAAR